MSKENKGLSIKTKTTLFVVLTLGVLTALMVTVQFRTSLDRVQHIESDQAVDQAERVVRQLENSLDDIGGTNIDWAWWDDSFDFIQDGNQEYRDDNLYAAAFTPIGIDLVAYLDTEGAVVYESWFVGEDELPVPEQILAAGQPGALLGNFDDEPLATPGGLVASEGDVFLVTGRSILTSEMSGVPAGVLLMGRHVSDDFVAELGELVNLDLTIEPCVGDTCANLTTEPQLTKSSESIITSSVVNSIDGTPVFRVQVAAARTMYQESRAGIERTLWILIAVGVAAVVFTVAGIRRLVLDPLNKLGSTVAEVARTNDPSLRAQVDQDDEIGDLAAGINLMLARLDNAQMQLVEAKERVEGASEAKSRFLSHISHELRTPINGVLAYAQLLQLDHSDGESGESLEQIVTSARHITRLVDEFLDIARIEAGAIPIHIESVSAGDVVGEVLKMTQPLADAQGVEVGAGGGDDSLVLADPLRLRQSILNLVSNAIKYGQGEEPVLVDIRPEGASTAIRVRDHGAGIPAGQLDRLFVPFDRLDADDGEQTGSGVGLSVTKQLVELMHGTIEVESQVGVGTTFTIHLPAPIGSTVGQQYETAA